MLAAEAGEDRREAARLRSEAYRERRRRGRVLVTVEVDRETVRALRRIGLIAPGAEGDIAALANASAHFLTLAPAVASMGEALFPAGAVMPGDDAG